jgi:tripartite-type tricarboxylate transporter receptor subunit TctC
VMAGIVPITFSDPSAKPLIEGGKLRMLAVTTAKRSRLFPDTPTMAEAGVPGYEAMNWYGIVTPTGTPAEAIQKMNAALREIMARPDVRTRLEGAGMEATSSTPAEFSQLIAGERTRWGALITKAGIKAE